VHRVMPRSWGACCADAPLDLLEAIAAIGDFRDAALVVEGMTELATADGNRELIEEG
jgi:hypothetical protein